MMTVQWTRRRRPFTHTTIHVFCRLVIYNITRRDDNKPNCLIMSSNKRPRNTSRAAAAAAAAAGAGGAGGAILVRLNLHTLLSLVIVVLGGLCIYFYATRTPHYELTTTQEYTTGVALPLQVVTPVVPPLADVLRNPYEAPLRDDRFFPTSPNTTTMNVSTAVGMPTGGAATINVPTQGPFIEPTYRQIGLLTRLKKEGSKKGSGADNDGNDGNDDSLVFPLMGKPLLANRDTWNFYTMNDKFHTMKLPVIHKGRSGTSENGCENIYTNDRVRVEGYNDEFRATVYENQTMRYLPYF